MARPLQTGLNYFPLDVTFDQDDKIALIESDFGIEGFSVIVKLLMKIYSEGYSYHWGEKEVKLFSRRTGVVATTVSDIVEAGLRWGIFDLSLFYDYNILTSRGIQKRYFEAVGRRKDVPVVKEYVLLSEQELEKYPNLNIVSLFPVVPAETNHVDSDVDSTELMSTLTTQSKVEESIVKESKSSSRSEKRSDDSDDDLLHILQEFESKIQVPTTQIEKQLKDWLIALDKEVILEAIRRTHLNGKSFGYLNAILTDFKQKGVHTYEDIAAYDQSFKYRQQSFTNHMPKSEFLPEWAKEGYTDVDDPVDESMNQKITESLNRIRGKRQH
ncbi:DnaD and phage-associated domain-containing protein [Alkalibacterium subtropicum]|uniref:DnaD and phage-associated domain-containing protein n=1 Tax=Alkalibacterium subtropicum TaxID=753702 RepID=A0A1I1GG52_9LACT|nr:Lin1244/Lin1753 domain-containing protein [Alkalibacterium subtropicum]SFC10514.1 DnaD and phage-associated domain-containing protein [Alkalibacterium subtropicum]